MENLNSTFFFQFSQDMKNQFSYVYQGGFNVKVKLEIKIDTKRSNIHIEKIKLFKD